jgi:hypothetical protein
MTAERLTVFAAASKLGRMPDGEREWARVLAPRGGAVPVFIFACAAVMAWWFWGSLASADELGDGAAAGSAAVADEPPPAPEVEPAAPVVAEPEPVAAEPPAPEPEPVVAEPSAPEPEPVAAEPPAASSPAPTPTPTPATDPAPVPDPGMVPAPGLPPTGGGDAPPPAEALPPEAVPPAATPAGPATPTPLGPGGLRTADPALDPAPPPVGPPAAEAPVSEPVAPSPAPPPPAFEPVAPVATTALPARSADPPVSLPAAEPVVPVVVVPTLDPVPFDMANWSFSALLPWSNRSPAEPSAAAEPHAGRATPPVTTARHRVTGGEATEAAAHDDGAAWITSSSASTRARGLEGETPMRPASLPAPLSAPPTPLPPSSGALGSGHGPFDLSQQLERSQLWAVVAVAAGAAAAATGRLRLSMLCVAPAGVCGRRPPFTPD